MPDQQRIAERLLSILTDRDHAHTIVGDLAEMGAARGSKGFWRSVALTALGLAWRPAALILGCVALEILIGATIALSMSTHPTRSTNAWPLLPATIIGFSAMLLSGVALFNAARHGLRDPIAQLAAALTLVGWIGGSFHFFSPVPLMRVVEVWAEAALRLQDRDLRMMERLVKAQQRCGARDGEELDDGVVAFQAVM